MNRDIKFRVWNPEKSLMLGEKQGQIVIKLKGQLKDSLTGHGTYNPTERNPKWPLMQYIGIKDKKKKDIYEGDVVEYEYKGEKTIGFISWDDMYCGFSLASKEFFGSTLINNFGPPLFKVVGNIYENPELIKNYEGD